jgi:hypothetical protein
VFRVLSVGLREADEFQNYSLVALLVFYKYMFKYKSPGRKCDDIVLILTCVFYCHISFGQSFVFHSECLIIPKWRGLLLLNGSIYVSGVRTYLLVKWCLNPLSQHVENFVRTELYVCYELSHITKP